MSMRKLMLSLIHLSVGRTRKYQRLVKFIQECSMLMGIGSGAGVAGSGEGKVLSAVLKKYAASVPVIFDVGANKGGYAQVLFDMAREQAVELHCFEPGKEAFAALETAFGEREGMRLNNFALGARREQRLLWYDEQGSALASFSKRRLDHFSIEFESSEMVEVRTVDEYCAANGIKRIHLLKMDTEGHELEVLRGATGMFAAGAVDHAQFEFGGCNIDTRTFFQDYFYFFKEYGFVPCIITPFGDAFPIREYTEFYEQFRTTNYLAVRADLL